MVSTYTPQELAKEARYMVKEYRKETKTKAKFSRWWLIVGDHTALIVEIALPDGWKITRSMAI